MKNFSHISVSLLLLSCFLLLCHCHSSNQVARNSQQTRSHDPNVIIPDNTQASVNSWENLFRKVASVEVQGSYPNLSLRIRGANSIHMTTEPLYVLEGIPLGHDFSSLARATTPSDVKSIRVVKGPDAALYGARGSNGVVVVTLKK
ncbi:MAG: TonB-dependent receptor plug domain-containing protein [Bacteroidota bacterium]